MAEKRSYMLALRNLPATHAAWSAGGNLGLRPDRVAMITCGISVGQRVKLTSDHPYDTGCDYRTGDVGVVERVSQAHVDVLFARTGQLVVCLASQLEVCDG